jgi:hypothetical protein
LGASPIFGQQTQAEGLGTERRLSGPFARLRTLDMTGGRAYP